MANEGVGGNVSKDFQADLFDPIRPIRKGSGRDARGDKTVVDPAAQSSDPEHRDVRKVRGKLT
jgi:hypothetical protein